jgi:hypothetical protein
MESAAVGVGPSLRIPFEEPTPLVAVNALASLAVSLSQNGAPSTFRSVGGVESHRRFNFVPSHPVEGFP